WGPGSLLSCLEVEGFALPGELLLPVAGWPAPTKITKSACPSIRPGALRRVPSLHRCSEGPALTGLPWPDNAFRRIPEAHPSTQRLRSAGLKGAVRAPVPLGAHPVGRVSRARRNPTAESSGSTGSTNVGLRLRLIRPTRSEALATATIQSTSSSDSWVPYRRPSGGVAQGVSGQDGRARQSRAREGPSLPAPGAAPERGKSGRPKRPDPDVGARFLFGYFLFARAKRK